MARSYEEELAPTPEAGLLLTARLRAGLSQGRLAERAGVPVTMVSAYERGKRRPTLETLRRLVGAAGFDVRLHLEPLDDHDDLLAEAEAHFGTADRNRVERQVAVWRRATPVAARS